MVVIADPGDALFGSEDLYIQEGAGFMAPAYYASLGFAVPAALGVQAAVPTLRPLVLVGDGAFQMTGMELGNIARYGMNPIVVVIDNDGYGTERPMLDGAFNDVRHWEYAGLPAVIGSGPRHQGRKRARDGGGARPRPCQHRELVAHPRHDRPRRPLRRAPPPDHDARQAGDQGQGLRAQGQRVSWGFYCGECVKVAQGVQLELKTCLVQACNANDSSWPDGPLGKENCRTLAPSSCLALRVLTLMCV